MPDYDVVEPRNQHIDIVGDHGGVFENKLIDLRGSDDYCVIYAYGNNWAIRNVGFLGNDTSGEGVTQVAIADDDPDGHSVVENVFHAGASGGNQASHGHGATGIQIPPASTHPHRGHIEIANCTVMGMADNAFYCSEDQDGTVDIDSCFGKNNYVSTFRINGNGTVRNSVAFNEPDGPFAGRPVWVWPAGGEAQLVDLDLDAGPYPDSIHLGRDWGTAEVYMENVRYTQGINIDGRVDVRGGGGNGGDPTLTPPPGAPMSAEEAAGSSGAYNPRAVGVGASLAACLSFRRLG